MDETINKKIYVCMTDNNYEYADKKTRVVNYSIIGLLYMFFLLLIGCVYQKAMNIQTFIGVQGLKEIQRSLIVIMTIRIAGICLYPFIVEFALKIYRKHFNKADYCKASKRIIVNIIASVIICFLFTGFKTYKIQSNANDINSLKSVNPIFLSINIHKDLVDAQTELYENSTITLKKISGESFVWINNSNVLSEISDTDHKKLEKTLHNDQKYDLKIFANSRFIASIDDKSISEITEVVNTHQ